MKSIASLVLNCSTLLGGDRSSRVNGRTLRVRNCKALALCALLLFAVSCKKDSKDEPSPAPGTQSITGNVSTPSWAVSDDYDMTSSMTVIASVDLSLTYADQVQSTGWTVEEDDLLAALDGNQCIGMAKPSEGLFYLYVTAPSNGSEVTLKYYSAKLKNLFTASTTLTYGNDAIIGSVSAPYAPQWKVAN